MKTEMIFAKGNKFLGLFGFSTTTVIGPVETWICNVFGFVFVVA